MKEMTIALCAKGNKLGRQNYWSGKSKTKQKYIIFIAIAVYLKFLMHDEGVRATCQETDETALEECLGANLLLISRLKS